MKQTHSLSAASASVSALTILRFLLSFKIENEERNVSRSESQWESFTKKMSEWTDFEFYLHVTNWKKLFHVSGYVFIHCQTE